MVKLIDIKDGVSKVVTKAYTNAYTFGRKHKKEITIGAIGTVTVIVGGILVKKLVCFLGENEAIAAEGDAILEAFQTAEIDNSFSRGIDKELGTAIDDAIFTDLAPEIEKVCFAPGITAFNTDRFYNIGDGLKKHISVTIENIME